MLQKKPFRILNAKSPDITLAQVILNFILFRHTIS